MYLIKLWCKGLGVYLVSVGGNVSDLLYLHVLSIELMKLDNLDIILQEGNI